MKRTALIVAVLLCLSASVFAADGSMDPLERAADLVELGRPDSAAVILYAHLPRITQQADSILALYTLAQAMEQLGRAEEQARYLETARRFSSAGPLAPAIDYAYARALWTLKRPDECVAVVDSSRVRYSDSPFMADMLFLAGNALIDKKEYRRASNIFRDIAKLYPGHPTAQESVMKEGYCLFRLDLIGGAIERFEHYTASTPTGRNHADALFYLGRCYEESKRPEDAITVYQRLLVEHPSYSGILDVAFSVGKLTYDTNRFTESANAFENYIANTPANSARHDEALLYRERIAYQRGQYTSTIEMFERYVGKYPLSSLTPDMLFSLARYHLAAGDTTAALSRYRTLITTPAYSAFSDSAAYLTADMYAEAGRRTEAVSFLKTLADETTSTTRAQRYISRIGYLYETWKRPDEAIQWYQQSLDMRGSTTGMVQTLTALGRVFRSMDRWLEAAKMYERIVQNYPSTPTIRQVFLALADIYYLQGDLKRAATTAERALRLADNRERPDILLYLAGIYEELDEAHALQLYSMVFTGSRSTAKQTTEALMKYGDLALRAGNRNEAVRAWNTIIAANTDSTAVYRARRQLSILGREDQNAPPSAPPND